MVQKNYSLWKNINYIYHIAFSYIKSLRYTLPLQMLCELLIQVFATMIPAAAVGMITVGKGFGEYLIILGGITILNMSVLYLKQYLFHTINYQNTVIRVKKFYIDNAVKQMSTDYINVEPQEKQVLIQKSINSLNSNWAGLESMMKNTPAFFVNMIGLTAYGGTIALLDPVIILIILLMSILNFILTYFARTYEEKHKTEFAKYERQLSYLYDNSTSLINGKDIRIYQMEGWFCQLFRTLIKKRVTWSKRVEYRYFLPSLSDNLLLYVRDIIAYGILISKAMNGVINPAAFTFFIGIIGGFSNWLNEAVNAYSNLRRANLGVNDYRTFVEIPEVFRHSGGCELPKDKEYPFSIEFVDVSFRYPGADKDTISHLNLKIDGGSKIALVGNNGAGKTTLVKLLSGLYYPTDGNILVNGKLISDYNLEEYHSLVGVVFQEVEIVAFTIAKNVAACTEKDINYDKVHQCLTLAGLKDKIDGLKDKEKTFLTQTINKEGIQLSGGEMQKLMLARALYKDAPLMILDEPTAALDPIAESELYEKYNDLTKDKTSLFISHRLSSTKFCDRILFLENGVIAEDGNHQELMENKGKYARMFDIQSHYYKEKGKVESNEEVF
ncbi:MAG: transporter related [Herbinix sp.]|jgi:ABC-type multidrug transport system fused ATPase/permease subunit|nr:transporter related [Herbinix sp.]